VEIIPAIDVRGGRCVRLYQGDYGRETVFSEDPVAVARHWCGQGAERLHIVDLDGAAHGAPVNESVVRAITQAVPIPVQVGGGIRDLTTIETVFGWGVARVVLGTAAVKSPEVVHVACRTHPDAVVVALDARNGKIAVEGWLEDTLFEATEVARNMARMGVPRFLYTDIARDGTSTEPNFHAVAAMIGVAGRPIIASGGVTSLEHIRQLRDLGVEAAMRGLRNLDWEG